MINSVNRGYMEYIQWIYSCSDPTALIFILDQPSVDVLLYPFEFSSNKYKYKFSSNKYKYKTQLTSYPFGSKIVWLIFFGEHLIKCK